MTPPINIDGTQITGASIDGSEVTSITVDGTEVFIPDSIFKRNGGTFATGDPTWADQATSDGSQDMSLSGNPQSSTLSNGVSSVSFDGSGDHGLTTLPAELEGSSLTEWSVEIAGQWTTTAGDFLTGAVNSGNDQAFNILLNTDEAFNADNGNLLIALQDPNGSVLDFAPTNNPNLNDGNRHDISLIYNDTTSNDVELIIDGSSVALSFNRQQSPDNFGSWDVDMATAARNNGGTIGGEADVNIGADRWRDTSINQQFINNF